MFIIVRPLGGAVAPWFGRTRAVHASGSFSGVLQNSFRSFIGAALLSMTLAVAGVKWEREEQRPIGIHWKSHALACPSVLFLSLDT